MEMLSNTFTDVHYTRATLWRVCKTYYMHLLTFSIPAASSFDTFHIFHTSLWPEGLPDVHPVTMIYALPQKRWGLYSCINDHVLLFPHRFHTLLCKCRQHSTANLDWILFSRSVKFLPCIEWLCSHDGDRQQPSTQYNVQYIMYHGRNILQFLAERHLLSYDQILLSIRKRLWLQSLRCGPDSKTMWTLPHIYTAEMTH